jgi:hypothetical protein
MIYRRSPRAPSPKNSASKSKEIQELFTENVRLRRYIARLEKKIAMQEALMDNFTSHGLPDEEDLEENAAIEGDVGEVEATVDPYDSTETLSDKIKCPKCGESARKVWLGKSYFVCDSCSSRGPLE